MDESAQTQRVVIEAYDGDLHCRTAKVILDDTQSATLADLLRVDLSRPFEIALEGENAAALLAFNISIHVDEQAGQPQASLYFIARSLRRYDGLSYDIHTGRELAMMLRGDKPMAFFTVDEGMTLEDLCEQPLAQSVAAGVIVEDRFSVSIAGGRSVQYVVFALPDEAWRSRALRLIKTVGVRWNDTLERLEGLLLGYTEAECDEYISLIKMPPSR